MYATSNKELLSSIDSTQHHKAVVHVKPYRKVQADAAPTPGSIAWERFKLSPAIRLMRLFDPSWFFLLAGAGILICVVLIPISDQLSMFRYQRDVMAVAHKRSAAELSAYSGFLDALEQEDSSLIRRLAISQCNVLPQNADPVAMVGSSLDASVDSWILGSIEPSKTIQVPVVQNTILRRIATGSARLWALIAGVILFMIGLLPRNQTIG